MRILGIDTSTRRGSVALVEDGRRCAHRAHEEPNSHAERLLPLIDELFAEAGWSRNSLERIGVGIGPGSFTGLRVGMALAQGLGLGLGVPVIGVPSLAAMARAVPASVPGRRLICLDARRSELFLALFAAAGTALRDPWVIPREDLRAVVAELGAEAPLVIAGEVCSELGFPATTALALGGVAADGETAGELSRARRYAAPDADLPDAHRVAEAAGIAAPNQLAIEPLYVREPDAVKPAMAPDALVRQLSPAELADPSD